MEKGRRAYGSFESHHPKDQCPDCGGKMTRGSVRCRACWAKLNPRGQKPCADCGTLCRGVRCLPCLKAMREQALPTCQDCGKTVARSTGRGAAKRCWNCDLKRRGTKPRRVCSVDGCERQHSARGLCRSHYQQAHTAVKGGSRITKNLLRRHPCQVCGYNRAHSDVHRLVSGVKGGRYVPGNMVAVCANCHREVHRGLIAPPEPLTEEQILSTRQ